MYLSSSLAYVVGPLAGGRLADPSLVSWFDYATPFWATAALLACVLRLTASQFVETSTLRDRAGVRLGHAFASVADAFRPGRLRRLFLANFVLYLAIFGFFRVYPMFLVNRFHMTVSRESLFVAWVAIPIVAANAGIVSWLAKRMSPLRTLTIGAGVLAVVMATIVIPNSEGPLWVTLGATALVLAVCLPAAATIVSEAAEPEEQGRALGSNQSLQVGAEAVSGLGGGLLAGHRRTATHRHGRAGGRRVPVLSPHACELVSAPCSGPAISRSRCWPTCGWTYGLSAGCVSTTGAGWPRSWGTSPTPGCLDSAPIVRYELAGQAGCRRNLDPAHAVHSLRLRRAGRIDRVVDRA